MKKPVLLIISLFCAATLNAQISKGDWVVSVGAELDWSKSGYTPPLRQPSNIPQKFKESAALSYALSPAVEYFISNRFSVGIAPFIQFSEYEFDYGTTHYEANNAYVWFNEGKDKYIPYILVGNHSKKYIFKLRDIGGRAFVKYYQPVAQNLYVTLKGYIFFSSVSNTMNINLAPAPPDESMATTSQEGKSSFSSYGTGIIPGIHYFISDRFSLELSFLNTFYRNDKNDEKVPYDYDNSLSMFDTSANPPFKRREKDFGVNWKSFSLSAGYKF